MSDFSRFVPAHIRKLAESNQPRPLKQSGSDQRPIALNLNENPFGPSPLALKAIERSLSEVHRYPEIQATALHEEIARFHNVECEQVLVTAGATELLCMVARTLLAPGLNAITSARSFIVYKLATQVTEGKLMEVAVHDNGYDLDAIAGAIDDKTRIVFVANPNNPTGTLVTADEVDRFVDRLPDNVLLVIDEAYGDFAEDFARKRGVVFSRSLEYVRQGRNVILLKTFSKAHGLAGLRVGYGIGPTKLISLFATTRTIFSISSVAQAAALAALRDGEHTGRAIKNNAEQAEVLSAELNRLGYPVARTWANFLYCELGENAAAFADRLQAGGVTVQPLGLWGAPSAIRVSIGTPAQNQRFLEIFENVAQCS
jgi:histidinol-phosphate aminotransferase